LPLATCRTRSIWICSASAHECDPAPLKSFLWVIEHLLASRGVSADRRVWWHTKRRRVSLAARAFWFLEFFGHPSVRVLDGGTRAWQTPGSP
jgi:thiosulfate/3-mercaptopyruvate sulfurtransferase